MTDSDFVTSAKFLLDLNLLRIPSVEQILTVAATPVDAALQRKALDYFLEEYSNAHYGSSCMSHCTPRRKAT